MLTNKTYLKAASIKLLVEKVYDEKGIFDDKDVDHNNKTSKYAIICNDGLQMKHLLTTFSSHLRHAFSELDVNPVTVIGNNEIILQEEKGTPRPFMDGFYLSNNPLREIFRAHRDYYHKIKGSDVPQMEIYIGDLHTIK